MYRKALGIAGARMNRSNEQAAFWLVGRFGRLGLRRRCKGGDLGMLCQIPPGQLRRLPRPPQSFSVLVVHVGRHLLRRHKLRYCEPSRVRIHCVLRDFWLKHAKLKIVFLIELCRLGRSFCLCLVCCCCSSAYVVCVYVCVHVSLHQVCRLLMLCLSFGRMCCCCCCCCR